MISIETLIGTTGFHHAEKWNHNGQLIFYSAVRSCLVSAKTICLTLKEDWREWWNFLRVLEFVLGISQGFNKSMFKFDLQLKTPSLEFNRIRNEIYQRNFRTRIQSRADHRRMTKKCSHLFVIPPFVRHCHLRVQQRNAIRNVPYILFWRIFNTRWMDDRGDFCARFWQIPQRLWTVAGSDGSARHHCSS